MPADRHRPRYHFTAARGWINDPNGIAWHGGRWHLFYQHNPAAPHWGDIHWGHASSTDLLHWRDEPLALAPSREPGAPDVGGCFSGSFANIGGVPTLFYTGETGHGQVQCVATCADPVSSGEAGGDGVGDGGSDGQGDGEGNAALRRWTKHPERTLSVPPPGVPQGEFRDPFIFRHGPWWYLAVGASEHSQRGQVLLYRSADGLAWHYRHPLYAAPRLAQGIMWECPCLLPLKGGRWLLTVSVWPNLGALWWTGRFDDERFVPEAEGVLDADGAAFAHLAAAGPDGRTLQWAWLDEQRSAAAREAAGWAGAMSVPRELAVDERGRLLARPAAEIASLRQPVPLVDVQAQRGTGTLARWQGACVDIEARFTLHQRHKLGLTLCAAPDGSELTRVVWWPEARRLVIEREAASLDAATRHQNVQATLLLDDGEPLALRVLLDHSVLEVYANGRLTLSTRVYPQRADSLQASAWAEGDATLELTVWAMNPISYSEERP